MKVVIDAMKKNQANKGEREFESMIKEDFSKEVTLKR